MWLLLVAGCKDKHDAPPPDLPFTLRGGEAVYLPFATAGEDVPTGTFTLRDAGGGGSTGRVSLEVPPPFDVEGDDSPLGPGEERTFTVGFSGSTALPNLFAATLQVDVDGQHLDVDVTAVLGDPALPDATWTTDEWGTRATLALPSAPFPYEDAPWDDPSVLVFFPPALTDDEGVATVTHLHGHSAVLADVVAEQKLVEQLSLSMRDAVLIVPQGPVDAADSDFGRLVESGGYGRLLRDVIAVLYRDGHVRRAVVGEAVLTAHSGGYEAAARMIDAGVVHVRAVHLFDALYGRADIYEGFVAGGGIFRSSFTATGGTDAENEELAATLVSDGIAVATSFEDPDLEAATVTIGPVDAAHADCVTVERSYARWLVATGLKARPSAGPELRSVVSDGSRATVRWRADPGGETMSFRVEGSSDGERWELLNTTNTSESTVPSSPFIRVVRSDAVFGDSTPSDTYGGSGDDWLIVDAFDRVFGGSYVAATHDFAAVLGDALGTGFSVASNEAVAMGEVDLGAYTQVLWMLGDEGVADRTFDADERAAVAAYVQGGGAIVVSGSEVGYATDATWLDEVLHAQYVSDDAGTTRVEGWEVGAAYPEDFPDVLDGDEVLWAWETGGAAAVGWNGQVVVVGFGLENLDDPAGALAELEGYL